VIVFIAVGPLLSSKDQCVCGISTFILFTIDHPGYALRHKRSKICNINRSTPSTNRLDTPRRCNIANSKVSAQDNRLPLRNHTIPVDLTLNLRCKGEKDNWQYRRTHCRVRTTDVEFWNCLWRAGEIEVERSLLRHGRRMFWT